MLIDERIEQASNRAIGAAIEVHRALGPGYLESIYEEAMAVEMSLRGIPFRRQIEFPLRYKGHPVGEGRLDFLVDDCLVLELKAVDALAPIHTIQVVSYLKALDLPVGLLLNFNVPILVAGLKRVLR
jgi:GxxExxY protein